MHKLLREWELLLLTIPPDSVLVVKLAGIRNRTPSYHFGQHGAVGSTFSLNLSPRRLTIS